MSVAQEVYRGTVPSAEKTKSTAISSAISKHQTTVDASNSTVGYCLQQTGLYAAYAAAVKAANAQKLADLAAAETSKQSAIDVARDTLRTSSGEYGY